MKIKNKRAELTSKQIITIIIIIISFAIILIFYFTLNLKSRAEEMTCKQSLVQRTLPFIGKYISSVQCKTKEICVNMGGSCSGVGRDVESVKIKNIEEISGIVNDSVWDCWGVVGGGEIKYDDEGVCGLCGVIYFDDEVESKFNSLDSSKFGHPNFLDDYNPATKKPLAVVSRVESHFGLKSGIYLVEYSADNLRELYSGGRKCDEYLF